MEGVGRLKIGGARHSTDILECALECTPGTPALDDSEPSTSAQTTATMVSKTKSRKYSDEYLNLGFTSTEISGEERALRVICSKILAADNMKPNKLKHLETLHSEYVNKPRKFFELKLTSYEKQKSYFKKNFVYE
ncbi:hypothetical protein QE152_g24275 [Popillia japonica]|uniref:Uncharacterized protein n=1 Tax=Popillia japonica TaxID=7064 RepID=A0AAW1KGH6_POPJA